MAEVFVDQTGTDCDFIKKGEEPLVEAAIAATRWKAASADNRPPLFEKARRLLDGAKGCEPGLVQLVEDFLE